MSATSLRELSSQGCRTLLREAMIGRVGVSVGALPAIFPVRFALHEHDVVFRATPGTLLADAVVDTVVAFEVDSLADDLAQGWSVLVVGRAETIEDPAELDAARRLPLEPWGSHDGDHFIRISTDLMSGREFVGSTARLHADDRA